MRLLPPTTPLPPPLAAVRETVTRLFAARIVPEIGGYEARREFPRPLVRAMGEAGLFGAAFPEEVGGSALGFMAVAVIAEEISRIRPDLGYCMNLQAMTCPFTILPGGGSDPAGAMRTTARREGDRYLLTGSKQWITFSHEADVGVLFARTDPAAGHKGITAFIVEPKSGPGYRADPIPMRNLSPVLSSCAVFLDDFAVPVANRLGAEGDGFRIAMNALEYGRLTVSSRLVGAAQGCLEHALDYARTREVGGRAIGRYQLVQGLVADMVAEIAAARALVRELAETMDAGLPANRIASVAKYVASRAAKTAVANATEIFGGYALADEYPISMFKGFIEMLNVGEGSTNVQKVLIAEDALGFKDANRASIPARRFPTKAAE